MRLSTATVALAICALLAAGCSDGESPEVLPTLTPSPTPSAAPVVVPSAATVHNPAGAAAFVRFYYDQVNLAYQRGDATLLQGLGDPQCSTCANFEKAVSDVAGKGQHMDGLAVRLLSAEAPPEQGGLVAVDVRADAPERRLIARDGSVVEVGKAVQPYHLTVYAKRAAVGWTIRAVKRLS